MEKKTIGKFISALRKANGMTQKELGEKLFVSDKTVSRWECDESTPELSLIPVIAEIFGITTDELLRGERNNPDREAFRTEEDINKEKTKSDKQFNRMLDLKSRKYKNLTLISFGITLLGLIIGAIINLGFSKGLIAFCVSSILFVTSEICQICFAVNARITPDEDNDTYTEKINKANTSFVTTAVTVSFFNIASLIFCLPLVTLIDGANFGLAFEDWFAYGFLFAAIGFFICYMAYGLLISKSLVDSGLLSFNEPEKERYFQKRNLLKKTCAISLGILLILYVCLGVLNSVDKYDYTEKLVFNTCEEFKEYVENDCEKAFSGGYGDNYAFTHTEIMSHPDISHNIIIEEDTDTGDEYKEFADHEKILDNSGNIICEYFYYPVLYHKIIFSENNDRTPITVITQQAYNDTCSKFDNIQSFIEVLMVLDILAAALVYSCVKKYKIYKKFK